MIPAYLLTSFAEETKEQNQINYTQEPTQDTILDENTTPSQEIDTNQQEEKAEKIQAPKESGVYTATVYVGINANYRADIKTRSFSISKSATNIDIVSDSNKIYDGKAYEPQVVVKDRNGKELENPNVSYTYYKGIIKLKEAPSKIGNYSVRVTYSGDEAHYGSSESMKFSITK